MHIVDFHYLKLGSWKTKEGNGRELNLWCHKCVHKFCNECNWHDVHTYPAMTDVI
jgi:hypothetical protein